MKRFVLLLLVLGLSASVFAATAAPPALRTDVLYLPNTDAGRKEAEQVAKLFEGRQEVTFLDLKPSDIRKPKSKDQPVPVYPPEMKRKGIEGTVKVAFVIDEKGNVIDAAAISSTNGVFAEAAVAAIRQWKFTPGSYQRTNIRTKSEEQINFSLRPTPR